MRQHSRAVIAWCAGVALLGMAAAPALACVPAPWIHGETEAARTARLVAEAEAYERDRQTALWAKADRVFTARVSLPVDPPPPPPGQLYDPRRDGPPKPPKLIPVPVFDANHWETRLVLEPVAALKAAAPARSFEIVETTSMTSCGYTVGFSDRTLSFSQAHLAEGDVVVVFLQGPYPTGDGVMGALKFGQVVAPEVKAALDKAGAAR